MDNYVIAENFSLLAKLMDIHGDNPFKAKSYASAAFTIDRLPAPLEGMARNDIFRIKGIGESTGKSIIEQLETGQLGLLSEYLQRTPPGILEMLSIKGIGPKKIATIWKELEIETLGELLYACNENRLTLYKGFGEKTQKNIKDAIEFYLGNQGSYLYQQIESYQQTMQEQLEKNFPGETFQITGEFRRQMEIINSLDWVTTAPKEKLIAFYSQHTYTVLEDCGADTGFKGKENVTLRFFCTTAAAAGTVLFNQSASAAFLNAWQAAFPSLRGDYADEAALFSAAGLVPIPPYLRETAAILTRHSLPAVIQPADIKAIIHSHSTWSDGVHTIEQMAEAAIEKGLEYLVISDHSKTAFYANGLTEERLEAQHRQIDALNAKYTSFRIFKSIESDILNDGSLDYDDEILAGFDLVIASVHSNLKMNEEKAMLRLINAIENPYTSILGHMTGRLLLSRNGYPVDHIKIIDACAANDVVIELNAHPRRLDIDWRHIGYALDKGVLISIDPDAHAIDGFDDCRYGVLAAQKAGLTKEQNLSSYSLKEFESFLVQQHSKRP
jgi:DNA polymerase (family 10)